MMKLPERADRAFLRIGILLSSLFFISYEVARAGRAAFTCDEAGTYLDFVSPNVLGLFNFNSANNHFLNSLLAKMASALGGPSEFVLRLPSLLAYAVYLMFVYLILKRLVKNNILILCGYLLLSLNPYVLDFFSLCRGYGLSLGLMMASLFFFFRFLETTTESPPASYRHLRNSLAAAGLAVLANFSLLNVYLSLVVLGFGIFIVLNRRPKPGMDRTEPVQKTGKSKTILWPALAGCAVLFNLLAISQDLNFAGQFFEPVTVEIAGLAEQEKQDIQILRLDIKNDEQALAYRDGLWRTSSPTYFTGLRFRGPAGLMGGIEQIRVRIGPETFGYDAAEIDKLKPASLKKNFAFSTPGSMSLKRSVIPAFSSVINWKGDRALLRGSFRRLSGVLGIFALAGGLLFLLGRILARLKILALEQFRPLASITFILALFIGYPLTILKRAGMLWWGGQENFVHDTVFSLINSSFYGKLYFRGQEWVVFSSLCLIVVAFSILFILSVRKNSWAGTSPGAAVLAILFLTAFSTIAQKFLLGNPYLIGRTGLFMIPLFTLLLVFLCQALSRAGPGRKALSIRLLAALTLLSLVHFAGRANTAMTVEWRRDADTKSMLKDLTAIKGKEYVSSSVIRLGIDETLATALRYYRARTKSAWLEVHLAPPYRGRDFYYVKDPSEGALTESPGLVLVKKYLASGNILVKSQSE